MNLKLRNPLLFELVENFTIRLTSQFRFQQNSKNKILLFISVSAIVLLLFGNITTHASVTISPKEQIKEYAERALAIFNDASLGEEAKKELFRKTILTHFDFNEIAKRVLGPHRKANESRMEEFTSVLADFFESVYINRALIGSAKEVKITVMGETIGGNYATVRSKIITPSGRETPVDYRLHFNGNEWKVYDIAVEGISMVSNYRSQFVRIIQRSSFDGLLQELRKKIQELKNK